MKTSIIILCLMLVTQLQGCAFNTRGGDDNGMDVTYEDVSSSGAVSGLGIESQDINSMTDKMMRDMLATPALAGRKIAPRIIIDDTNFVNESSAIINKRLITERLMIGLNRAAAGRMQFIDRQSAIMVERERTLKRQNVVGAGTLGNASMAAGGDFGLSGRIMSLSSAKATSGKQSRYFQISFKMVDLETSIAMWTGLYEFKKSGQDDVIYR